MPYVSWTPSCCRVPNHHTHFSAFLPFSLLLSPKPLSSLSVSYFPRLQTPSCWGAGQVLSPHPGSASDAALSPAQDSARHLHKYLQSLFSRGMRSLPRNGGAGAVSVCSSISLPPVLAYWMGLKRDNKNSSNISTAMNSINGVTQGS